MFPYYMGNKSIDYNRSMIIQTINWLDSTKELVSIQLPNVTIGAGNGPGGAAEEARLHIFAVSMVPATGSSMTLAVQYARSTMSWIDGTNKTQIVRVTVNNVGDQWVRWPILSNSRIATYDAAPQSPQITTDKLGAFVNLFIDRSRFSRTTAFR